MNPQLTGWIEQTLAPRSAAGMLSRITIVLAMAWLIQAAVARVNPRWRVMLWRLTAVAVIGLPLAAVLLPVLSLAWLPAAAVSHSPLPTVVEAELLPKTIVGSVPAVAEVRAQTDPEARSASAEKTVVSGSIDFSPSWQEMAIGVWIVGVVLSGMVEAIAWLQLRRLRQRTAQVSRELVELGEKIAGRLGCERRFAILQSDEVASPCVVGVFRPTILLPAVDCDASQRSSWPAILAHEIAHLAHADVVWDGVLRWLARVLWFHPLIWKMRAAHLTACDAVSDATAADYLGDVDGYGRLLAQMALRVASGGPRPALQMARRSSVRQRIAALQRHVYVRPLSKRLVWTAVVACLLCLAVSSSLQFTHAQTKSLVDRYGDPLPPGATARLGTIRHQQADGYFLPDNQTVVSHESSSYSPIVLWNARTGVPLRAIDVGDVAIQKFVLSPDGTLLAVSVWIRKDRRDELRVLDVKSGRLIRTFPHQTPAGRPFAFTPDGKQLVSLDRESNLRIEEITTGKEIDTRSFPRDDWSEVSVSSDGKWIGIGVFSATTNSQKYFVWEWQTGGEPRELRADDNMDPGGPLVFSPDSEHIASVASGGLHIWDVRTGKVLRRPVVAKEHCSGPLAYSLDGKQLFATTVRRGGENRSGILVWNTETWEAEKICDVEGYGFFSISPEGKLLVSGKHVFDVATRKELNLPDTHRSQLTQIVNVGQDRIASASYDGSIRIWEAATGKQLQRFDHKGTVRSIAVSPNGRQLVSNSIDGTVALWDLQTGKQIYQVPGHRKDINWSPGTIGFLADGDRFCSFGPDFHLRIHDVRTGKLRQDHRLQPPGAVLPAENAKVDIEKISHTWAAQFSPDGQSLALDLGRRIFVYETLTGKERFAADNAGGPITAQSFSPDGQRLLVCARGPDTNGKDYSATLWNLKTRQKEVTIDVPNGGVSACCFSPDGQRFAVPSSDDRRRWKVTIYKLDGEAVATLPGVPGWIQKLEFTSAGQGLITALSDGTLLVWNASALVPVANEK